MQLVDFPRDPRDFAREVDLIAQHASRVRIRAQGVQRAADDGTVSFLIVEDGQRADAHEHGEGRDRHDPAHAAADGVERR